MFKVDNNGKVIHKKIKLKITPSIEKKPLINVRGLIIHQTGGATAKSAFSSYQAQAAH